MYMYDDVFCAGGRYYEIKVEVHIEQICVCKLLYSYQVSYMFCSKTFDLVVGSSV